MRNQVNYSQKLSVWHPYSNQSPYCRSLFDRVNEWKDEPSDIDLASYEGKELRTFQATCNFIVALFRETAIDMAGRCTLGRSFLDFGSLAILNLLNQGAGKRRR
jgi:hypothetical protein